VLCSELLRESRALSIVMDRRQRRFVAIGPPILPRRLPLADPVPADMCEPAHQEKQRKSSLARHLFPILSPLFECHISSYLNSYFQYVFFK